MLPGHSARRLPRALSPPRGFTLVSRPGTLREKAICRVKRDRSRRTRSTRVMGRPVGGDARMRGAPLTPTVSGADASPDSTGAPCRRDRCGRQPASGDRSTDRSVTGELPGHEPSGGSDGCRTPTDGDSVSSATGVRCPHGRPPARSGHPSPSASPGGRSRNRRES